MTEEQQQYLIQDFGEIEKTAKCHHCTVLHATDSEIFLDLDDGSALDQFEKMLPKVKKIFPMEESGRWRSKSGKGTHVVLLLASPMPSIDRTKGYK